MITWPEELVADIARRKCVIFLGAGVSKNSCNEQGVRPKDWKEFLTDAAGRLPEGTSRAEVLDCIAGSDYLTACDLVKKYLRPDGFKSLLLQQYSDPRFSHSQVHDDICRLDSRYVLTTNFDKLYEVRANHIQRNSVIVKNYYDEDAADILRRKQRSVLKVHGTIDAVDRTIFTRRDYAQARTRHAHFYKVMESLFMTNTFVFLGASMRDPDIQMLLEDNAYRFSGTRPHFMVMPTGSAPAGVKDIMEESMNLRALEYSPANGHEELAKSLVELLGQVEAARANLTETQDW